MPSWRGAFWRLQWCWTGMRGFWQHGPAAWTGRRCATGCIATTRMVWPGWPTGHGLGARPLYRTGNGPRGEWVQSGPDRKTDGVVRWRCADLRDRIAAHFGIRMHERSVGKLLHALDFS